LIAVTSDSKDRHAPDLHPAYYLTQKYVDPVVDIMECLPMVLPPLGNRIEIADVLDHIDGLLLTGSPSNIEPHHYGQAPADPNSPSDPPRDALTLPLLRAAIERGVPVLAICRGFQEINVALGGTLHQAVHDVPGMLDHREDHSAPLSIQYGPAHEMTAVPGSLLENIIGQRVWQVNSVHGQGVAQLAPSLVPQAVAPDGLIEAFTLRDPRSFLLGVQWHPEWQATENPVSVRMFTAFADACRAYAVRRANAPQHDKDG
jgi:putative glutamine amidotransferase